jgi:hypothetical protein
MKPHAISLAALLPVLAAGPLWAQPLTREDLAKALAQRDQQIADLQRRIAELERERATTAPPIATIPAPAPAAAPRAPATAPADEEAELAALSRTLVQRGGLVLPTWRAEFIPSFAYSTRIVQGLALAPTPEGVPTVADQRLRNDQLHATAGFRLGLPWASQIEVDVPAAWIRQSRTLGDGTHVVNEDSGFGDVNLSLSHQIFREEGWRPDLTGAISWRFPTGHNPFRVSVPAVAPGTGLPGFSARLTTLKSSDPMVFFTTLSYAHDLPREEAAGTFQTGDQIGLNFGAILAVSPSTSMTFGLDQEFRSRSQINHVGVPATDTTASTFQLGFDRVLTPRLLLDLTVGVGLTRDAPDYSFQISLPYRFR